MAKMFDFSPYAQLSTANLAVTFKGNGKFEQIVPGTGTDEKDAVIYFWNNPKSGRVIYILRPEKNTTKEQLSAIEGWLKANYFRLAKPEESWKSGSNDFASAPVVDIAESDKLPHEVGLFIAMMKKSAVNQKKVDAGCEATMNWLKKPWKDTVEKNAGGSQPANNGGNQPANTGNNTGSQPANNTGSQPANNGGNQPANTGNNGGSQPANTAASTSSDEYDDSLSAAENLQRALRRLAKANGGK